MGILVAEIAVAGEAVPVPVVMEALAVGNDVGGGPGPEIKVETGGTGAGVSTSPMLGRRL